MPSGAKKGKASKKKKELEAFGASPSNKALNVHGYDEHGSQDEGESDGNLSSPVSQGNGEFWTRDSSPSPLSRLGKDTVKEKTEDADVLLRHGHEESGVDKPSNSFYENVTHNTSKAASEEAGGTLENVPADDFVSKVVIPDRNKQVESSDSVQHKSDESEEKHRPEEAKKGSIPESAAETSKDVKIVKESQVPEFSEEKSLLLSGPPVVRNSWLSCCGLFDVIGGSGR
ncbi:hypothetical protein Rs2_31365 [Raphanus sativus]|uniref:Uncharacterized protein LOC108838110 isoform X2 n=1 Tax=Raphanus sativus TaxID=3726 RepID=A0A9W3C0D7_RAPSA|nr:uncharacterized protein LOC108838110 isoform X2 [Raphanus sativus]KAJ4891617.1 hypothetical protein Rs2_31365 [Raphanus sativus]